MRWCCCSTPPASSATSTTSSTGCRQMASRTLPSATAPATQTRSAASNSMTGTDRFKVHKPSQTSANLLKFFLNGGCIMVWFASHFVLQKFRRIIINPEIDGSFKGKLFILAPLMVAREARSCALISGQTQPAEDQPARQARQVQDVSPRRQDQEGPGPRVQLPGAAQRQGCPLLPRRKACTFTSHYRQSPIYFYLE